MRAYLVRRLLGAVPLLLSIAALSFVFMHAMPGGPDVMLLRVRGVTDEQVQRVRREFGLHKPVLEQFVSWVRQIAGGDMGISYSSKRPVRVVIGELIPNTLRLAVPAVLLSLVLALAAGVLSALWRYSWFDHLITGLSYVGLAMPVFWFGLMLQLLFAVNLQCLPSSDMTDEGGGLFSSLRHLALPVLTLAIVTVGGWSRFVRTSMIDVMNQDYVRTARAKGAGRARVTVRHMLRTALAAFVTVVAMDIPLLLAGAVLTETVFGWPGLGRLFFSSLKNRDYPVLMGLLVYSAVLIVIFNLIADLAYAWLDPRVRYAKKRS